MRPANVKLILLVGVGRGAVVSPVVPTAVQPKKPGCLFGVPLEQVSSFFPSPDLSH